MGASYTWHNIWATKKVVQDGLCWRVGKGDHISIYNHASNPGSLNYRLSNPVSNSILNLVADIIDHNLREWKVELISNIFDTDDAGRILQIPLARISHKDELVWRCELIDTFSMKSAYKLLQGSLSTLTLTRLQTISQTFYK